MKKRKDPTPKNKNFIISDGTMEHGEYDSADYADFISNGMTNNEKIDALEYYETFLSPQNGDEG